jgi:hypothetical protein
MCRLIVCNLHISTVWGLSKDTAGGIEVIGFIVSIGVLAGHPALLNKLWTCVVANKPVVIQSQNF